MKSKILALVLISHTPLNLQQQLFKSGALIKFLQLIHPSLSVWLPNKHFFFVKPKATFFGRNDCRQGETGMRDEHKSSLDWVSGFASHYPATHVVENAIFETHSVRVKYSSHLFRWFGGNRRWRGGPKPQPSGGTLQWPTLC